MTLSHCTLLIHCTPLIHSCILHTSHSFLHIAHLSFTPAYCTPLIHTRILHTSHSLLHIAHLSFTPAYCTPLTHSCILHIAPLSLTSSHCPPCDFQSLPTHNSLHTSHSLLHNAHLSFTPAYCLPYHLQSLLPIFNHCTPLIHSPHLSGTTCYQQACNCAISATPTTHCFIHVYIFYTSNHAQCTCYNDAPHCYYQTYYDQTPTCCT